MNLFKMYINTNLSKLNKKNQIKKIPITKKHIIRKATFSPLTFPVSDKLVDVK